jgi:ABC-type nickel/cobalt efflux system permease component RcnA
MLQRCRLFSRSPARAALGAGLAVTLWPTPAAPHSATTLYAWTRQVRVLVAPGSLTLHVAWAAGEVLGRELRQELDTNDDGRLSDEEKRVQADRIAAAVDGRIELWVDDVAVPVELTRREQDVPGEEIGLRPINVELYASVPVMGDAAGRHRVRLRDASSVAKLHDNLIEIVMLGNCTCRGSRLDQGPVSTATDYAFLQPTGSYELWLDWDCGWAAGAPATAVEGAPRPSAAAPTAQNELGRLLAQRKLSPALVLFALLVALLLGAVHALSPGHGKTIVAAYLVGSRGTVGHAVLLGLIVTVTHVLSVVLLGVVTLWLSDRILPERLLPWLTVGSGLLVVAVGSWMLVTRGRAWSESAAHDHPHPHVHLIPHHPHHLDAAAHPSAAASAAAPGRARLGQLLALGISGGLVPCPSALVVLLAAVSLHRVLFGLALIASFSVGLAAVLILVGVLMVKARQLFGHFDRFRPLAQRLPVASAVAVTFLGVLLTLQALGAGGFWRG